jgi:hypothetical protein
MVQSPIGGDDTLRHSTVEGHLALDDLIALSKIVDSVTGAIRPFTDPVFREAGNFVANGIRYLNWEASVRMARRAQRILVDHHLKAGPVVPKLLVPILESAALEHEDEALDRWSNMLARASAGEDVHPSYIDILRQLTPADVLLLDWLRLTPPALESPIARVGPTIGLARQTLGFEPKKICLILDNLRRQQLIELGSMYGSGAQLRKEDFEITESRAIEFTTLGEEFITACTVPPAKKEQ